MNCSEIVKKYLIDNGYDGLVYIENYCGCSLDDFNTCGEMVNDCEPAYKWPLDCNSCDEKENCENAFDQTTDNYCMRTVKQTINKGN